MIVKIRQEELEAWRDLTTSSFQLQMFPGNDFFLHSAQPLLNSLQKVLLQAVGEGLKQRNFPRSL